MYKDTVLTDTLCVKCDFKLIRIADNTLKCTSCAMRKLYTHHKVEVTDESLCVTIDQHIQFMLSQTLKKLNDSV